MTAVLSFRAAILVSIVSAGMAAAALAQPDPEEQTLPGVMRSNMTRAQLLEFAGSEVITFNGEFAPSGSSGRHRHPGTEVMHVISGTGVMLQDGRDPVDLEPGVTVLAEPSVKGGSFVHEVRNLSSTEPLRTLIVLLVDEGEPPSMPAD